MTTTAIEIQEVQKRFSELVPLVEAGDEIIVLQAMKPVIKLVPAGNGGKQRIAGLHAGMGWISEDFDEPLPDEFWTGQA